MVVQMNCKDLIRQLFWLHSGASDAHLSEDWKENKYNFQVWEKKKKKGPRSLTCILKISGLLEKKTTGKISLSPASDALPLPGWREIWVPSACSSEKQGSGGLHGDLVAVSTAVQPLS